jgi:hypothetical protein
MVLLEYRTQRHSWRQSHRARQFSQKAGSAPVKGVTLDADVKGIGGGENGQANVAQSNADGQ